ncbi:hypothetical protein EJ06DRAFT_571259 [Trichodelitschia bisporula]|uniref:Zn(2)-C6 fungal-type domain-containing protein n=1 Tax=Trichodelitschia bisporula TaxID=703511 RepID=A0A6G1HIV0_9PEZI|nr:hypothetical protein EJ06DRAFT_571259 [Trichodelitschia bisporula]
MDAGPASTDAKSKGRVRSRRKDAATDDGAKRRCVSTACIACRKRKSKCDGNLPACAACSSVYNTKCVYDPNSDHRRKGVYKKDDKLKTRNSTLEILIEAILNFPESEVPELVRQIRTCESLDAVAEAVLARETGIDEDDALDVGDAQQAPFETQLSGRMAELQLEDGSTRYIGGTSNLIFFPGGEEHTELANFTGTEYASETEAVASWTEVTDDPKLVLHLIHMYFAWHYTFFTTLSKPLFWRDFVQGRPPPGTRRRTEHCTPLLVNAMLALGCHFTAWPGSREYPEDAATAGDHFFKEAKRLIMANDEHEKPRLTTVQALALMSVREAGCGREAKGWVYSGMSFRMACDLGLNLDSGSLAARDTGFSDEEVDARRITFWGCFLFDKCWSNYLGRLPQLPASVITVPKFEVFPHEDADIWAAYTDHGVNEAYAQPSRTRAVALQISALCEISSDLMSYFYNPTDLDKSKGKQSELKKLSAIHQRLEAWRRNLPRELEPKEGGLPSMLVMHMFFQLLYIHLFRPFLKYTQSTSPLPQNVSPRRLCTQAAAMISKLLRLYKRSHGLRQICNIAVYIVHSACTIHLLNLPDKNARRDITHGVKELEEIAESWLCARRTLAIISILSRKWKVDLPEEAATVLTRTDAKFGVWGIDFRSRTNTPSHKAESTSPQPSPNQTAPLAAKSFTTVLPDMIPRTEPPNLYTASMPQISAAPAPDPNRPEGSPSALFGPLDNMVRDNNDWWFRDQSQLAMGFDQWPLPDVGATNSGEWLGAAGVNDYSLPMGTAGLTAGPDMEMGEYAEGKWYL